MNHTFPIIINGSVQAQTQYEFLSKLLTKFFKNFTKIFLKFSANVIVLAQGCSAGWMSPSLLDLLSDDSPLPNGKLTLEEASWIGSLFSLG